MSCELSALTDSITSHGHSEEMAETNIKAVESTLHIVSDFQQSKLLSTVSDKVVLHSQEHISHDLSTHKIDSLNLDPVYFPNLEPKLHTLNLKLEGESRNIDDSSMKAVEIEDCMKYSSFVLDLDQSPDSPDIMNDILVKDQHDSTLPATEANDSRTAAVQNSHDSTSFNFDESVSEQQTPSNNLNR